MEITAEERQRARTIIQALSKTADAMLIRVGTHAGPPLESLLKSFVQARAAPDPEAAVVEVLRQDESALLNLPNLLTGLENAVGSLSTRAGQQVAGLRRIVSGLGQQRDELIRVASPSLEALQEIDPRLAARVEQSIQAIRTTVGPDKLEEIAQELEALAAELASAREVTPELPQQVARLKRLQAEIEGMATQLGELSVLTSDLRRLAQERGVADADAILAGAEAEVAAGLQGEDAAATRRARVDAFNAALLARDLHATREAARPLQLAAAEQGRFDELALICHRVAELASTLGDRRVEVLSRLEMTSALSRLPEHAENARFFSERAGQIAEEAGLEPFIQARVLLTRAEIEEQLGDLDAARNLYSRLLRRFKDEPRAAREIGRAALRCGRLMVAAGLGHQGKQHLQLGHEIGRGIKDWGLYAPALQARLELALQKDDLPLVRSLLEEGTRLAPAMSPAGAEVVRQWMGIAAEILGEERLQALLAGD